MALKVNGFGEFVDDFDPYAPMALRKGGEERRIPHEKPRIRRTCPMCQRNFWADGQDDHYCSAKCWRAATGGVRQLPDGSYEGECAVCGATWRARSPKRLYCSTKCKSRANRGKR